MEEYAAWRASKDRRVPSFLTKKKWDDVQLEKINTECVEQWYREILNYETVIWVGGGGRMLINNVPANLLSNKDMRDVLYCPIRRIKKNDSKDMYFIDSVSSKPYEGQLYRLNANKYELIDGIGEVGKWL